MATWHDIGPHARRKREVSEMTPALLSSARMDWQTPPGVLDLVRGLGQIDLDPCTTADNPTEARRFYAPPQDGLTLPWGEGLAYVNPPYGREIGAWVDRCHRSALGGLEVVLLTPSRTDTRWFTRLWETADAMCFWRGRIRFAGAPHPAPFPSLVTYFGEDPWLFASVFREAGAVQVLR